MSFLLKNFINKTKLVTYINKHRILCKTSNNFISSNQCSSSSFQFKWNKSNLESLKVNNYLNRRLTRALSFTNKSEFR